MSCSWEVGKRVENRHVNKTNRKLGSPNLKGKAELCAKLRPKTNYPTISTSKSRGAKQKLLT